MTQSTDVSFELLPDETIAELYRLVPTTRDYLSLSGTSRRLFGISRDRTLRQAYYRLLCKGMSGNAEEFERYVRGQKRDFESDYRNGVFDNAFDDLYFFHKNKFVESARQGLSFDKYGLVLRKTSVLIPREIGLLRTKKLLINAANIRELPEEIADVKGLESLDFEIRSEKGIPETLGRLKGLRKLAVRTRLSRFPSYLSGMTRLEGLRAPLGDLSPDLLRMERLRVLDVSGGMMRSIPSYVADLRSLTALDVSDMPFESLPSEVFRMHRLRKLLVKRSNMERVPDEIDGLTDLRTLAVGGGRLTYLPGSIGGLTMLEELEIADAPLASLPESIGELVNLRELTLLRLDLTELPATLTGLPRLEWLYIDSTFYSSELLDELFENGVTIVADAPEP